MIRVAGIADDSIVDGPGLRFTVFTQGCPHHCPGCHNPDTHDPAGGRTVSVEELGAQMVKNPPDRRAHPLRRGALLPGRGVRRAGPAGPGKGLERVDLYGVYL